jgi:hypothetical protein
MEHWHMHKDQKSPLDLLFLAHLAEIQKSPKLQAKK